MKKSAIFSILITLLLAFSIIHKIRKGMDDRESAAIPSSSWEPVRQPASPAPAPASAAAPVAAAPVAAVPVAAPAVPAAASESKLSKSFDAALERIRNNPKLSLLERRQRETELSGMYSQMMRSEAALSRVKIPQAEQAAAAGTASGTAVAAATPAPPTTATDPASDLPYGTPIPGRPGFITSPFAFKHQVIDATGLPAGMEIKCPYTNKLFRIPAQ